MTSVALRPAVPADQEFCYRLHKAAMGEYVAAIWGWDEQKQRDHHTRGFNPGRWLIITVDGADAGLLDVDYQPDAVYLSRIELLPAYQGRGIGTWLIRELITTAHRRGQPLELDVFTVNHRAQALYRRLGLREVPGSDPRKLRMRSAAPGCAELTGRAGRGCGQLTGLAYHRSCG
jgi:ribosomal protein S18 acetylase RimI-like enzyme